MPATIRTRDRLNAYLGSSTIRRMHERQQWKTYAQTLFVLSVYGGVAAGSIASESLLVRAVATIFLGTISIGWFAAIHECVHHTFHRNRKINHAFGVFWSCPVLLNYSLYRYYHIEHHRYATIEGDPEPPTHFDGVWSYLKDLPTVWFIKRFTRLGLATLAGRYPPYVKKPQHKRDVLIDQYCLLVWLAAALLATAYFPVEALLAYWLPLALYFPMITVTGLPEHYLCEPAPGVLINTRTTRSNRFMRRFYWNNNYHAEHHAFPQVPFYNLSKLHKKLEGQLPYTTGSFLGFHAKVIGEIVRGPRG